MVETNKEAKVKDRKEKSNKQVRLNQELKQQTLTIEISEFLTLSL